MEGAGSTIHPAISNALGVAHVVKAATLTKSRYIYIDFSIPSYYAVSALLREKGSNIL